MRFTLHRHPSRPVSARTDRPSGGDVDSSIQVGVVAVAAGLAPERLAITVSWCTVPALRTRLTRIRRVDPLDPAGGFLLEPLDQQAPAACEDAPVQAGLGAPPVRQVAARPGWVRLRFRPACHLCNPEVFDADHVEAARKICGRLLDPVLAASHGTGMQFRYRGFDTLPAVRTALRSGEPPLKVHKSPPLGLGQSRALEQFPGGKRSRHSHAAVNADDLIVAGGRDRLRYGSKRDMPAAQAVMVDPVRPRVRQYTAYPEAHPADLRNQHPRPLTAHLLNPAGLRADDPEPFVPSDPAPRRTSVATRKVVSACLIEVPQRLLLDSLRTVAQPGAFGSRLGQLPRLLNETRRGAFISRPHRPLLDGQVPHVPGMPALRQQASSLRRRGIQAIAGHVCYPTSHSRQFGDDFEGRESRFLPAPEDGHSLRPI